MANKEEGSQSSGLLFRQEAQWKMLKRSRWLPTGVALSIAGLCADMSYVLRRIELLRNGTIGTCSGPPSAFVTLDVIVARVTTIEGTAILGYRRESVYPLQKSAITGFSNPHTLALTLFLF